jgi:nitrate/nitrite transporter NarK
METSNRSMSSPAVGEPLRPEASLGELFTEMTTELGRLMHQEVELAKVEAKADMSRTAKVAAMMGAAGLAGWLGVLFVSLALAWLLDQAMNRALAFALVAVVWLIAAAVLYASGRRRAKDIEVLPTTIETLKEDVEWAKAQKS